MLEPNLAHKGVRDAVIHLDEAWSQVSRQIARDIKDYAFCLPPNQVYLLRLLDRVGPQRMSDLADLLEVSQGGCTTLIDRALEAELVERRRDPEDRRVVWVAISAHGEQVLDKIRELRAAILTESLAQVPQAEIEDLATLLDRVADAILAHRTQPEPGLISTAVFTPN